MNQPDKPQSVETPVDDLAMVIEVVHEKYSDALTPGYWVEFAPDEADLAGAFEEGALDSEDAAESDVDLLTPE